MKFEIEYVKIEVGGLKEVHLQSLIVIHVKIKALEMQHFICCCRSTLPQDPHPGLAETPKSSGLWRLSQPYQNLMKLKIYYVQIDI